MALAGHGKTAVAAALLTAATSSQVQLPITQQLRQSSWCIPTHYTTWYAGAAHHRF